MDPSTLSDEQLEEALNGNPPEEGQEDAPVDPPAPDESEETEPAPDDANDPVDEPEGEPDEEEKPPSRREQLRIQQVLERVKQNAPAPKQTERRDGAIDYANELDADPTVIKRLEEDRQLAEQSRYQEGLKQAQGYEWRTLLQIDAPQMEAKYTQLDKNSPDFHPAISNALTTQYLQMSDFDQETGLANNPGMRWNEYVESMYELADEINATRTQKSQTNVKRQAATTGLRPNGQGAKLDLTKAPEDMTDEELDAMIAMGPKRK